MKQLNKKIILRQIDSLLVSVLVTAIAASGWFDELDYKVSDWLYQKTSERSPDIVIIGIDSTTLSKLGSISSWIRKDIAQAIKYLNENDPNARPAAIGIDFLFTGENHEAPDWDTTLVEVVAKSGNVVVASAAIVDDDLISDSDPYAVWDKTWQWDSPFKALAEVADIGHICEPYDADGIIRNQLLYINAQERGRIDSFARVLYEKF